MPQNKNDLPKVLKGKKHPFNNVCRSFFLLVTFMLDFCLIQSQVIQLPQKIFNIQQSHSGIPVIKLSDLSSEFEPISLLLDSGSSELALFDNQCYGCRNTFSACPHIKAFSNQTFINYLLTQFKGDFSYLSLASTLRIRFFCVLQVEGNDQSLQTNGVLGIQIRRASLLEKILKEPVKETNGIKVWRKIIQKIYESDLISLEKIPRDNEANIRQKIQLQYAIFYTSYHLKLIFGDVLEIYSKSKIGELQIFEQIFTDSIFANKIEETEVHLDSGSSVIVLPSNIAQIFLNELNQKTNNQCQLQSSQIQCSKLGIKNLIEQDFKFSISIYQKQGKTNPLNLSIGLQQLIQKTHNSKSDSKIMLKIISHQGQKQSQQKFIILGVPFFKQYIFQYDIPFESEQKAQTLGLMSSSKINQLYKLRVYAHRQLVQKTDAFSPYEHLIKKYDKNIKLFTFFYLFFVFLAAYLVVNLYWWVDRLINGNKQLV